MADIRIKWEAPLNQAIVDSIAIYRYDGITIDCAEVSENGVLLTDTLASDSTVYDDLNTPELGLITYGVFSKNPSGLSQCALSSISLEPTISQSPTNLITIYLDASNAPSGLTQVNADFTVGPESITSTLELNPKYGVDVGHYVYPFFLSQAEADYFDSQNGGSGSNHSMTYQSITYYMPDNGGTHSGSSAPSDIVINGNTFSYDKINTGVEVAKLDESEEAPTGLTAVEEVIIVAPTSGPTELTSVEEVIIVAPTSGPTELTSVEEEEVLAQGDILTNTLDTDVDLDMLYVEPGTFTMGSPTTETGRQANETEHNVSLTQGFYLGKYEVTQAQYEAVMTGNTDSLSATPSQWPNNPNRPVEKVSWDDVQIFLTRLNAQQSGNIPAGWAYVLPTEAQWEYACRAGTTTAYSWGNTIATSNANYSSSGLSQTSDAGNYAANPWGFFDMHGNVYEWTADWYGSYGSGAQTDPEGPASGSARVRRGGSWNLDGTILRSAYRSNYAPSYRSSDLGFRVALVPSEPQPPTNGPTELTSVEVPVETYSNGYSNLRVTKAAGTNNVTAFVFEKDGEDITYTVLPTAGGFFHNYHLGKCADALNYNIWDTTQTDYLGDPSDPRLRFIHQDVSGERQLLSITALPYNNSPPEQWELIVEYTHP
jgi:formylglycine-generating enzyme required for sulfatase activity